jgi:hypothetical protein
VSPGSILLFVASKVRTIGWVFGMCDQDLVLSMVAIGYLNLRSLRAGEFELEYQGEELVGGFEITGS